MSREKGISKAEAKAREILSRYPGRFVSRRDGHIIVKIVKDNKSAIIWIRQSPITREALSLFKKIISRHEYDGLFLIRLYEEADYVKYEDLALFNEITKNI